jgi:hypothetical protein
VFTLASSTPLMLHTCNHVPAQVAISPCQKRNYYSPTDLPVGEEQNPKFSNLNEFRTCPECGLKLKK